MASAKERLLRDQRDHLIDLLGLGQTYPLQDLPLYLPTAPYLVTYNNPARIGVDTSQPAVLYQLHEDQQLVERTPEGETGPGSPVERPGNQARIQLSSYNIQEDKTFQVYATKFTYLFCLPASFAAELDQAEVSAAVRQLFDDHEIALDSQVTVSIEKQPGLVTAAETEVAPASDQPTFTWLLRAGADAQTGARFLIRNLSNLLAVYQMSNRAVYLHQVAQVKVGLDQTLVAWINDAPFLDSVAQNQPRTAARLIDYDRVVTVEIENSQEGVYYRLLAGQLDAGGVYPAAPPPAEDQVISTEDDEGAGLGKLGTGENITLVTTSIKTDIDIRIRATKTFPAADGRPDETALLAVILPLRVRANPAPAVSVAPAPVIDYNQAPNITLAGSQSEANYSLYLRSIPDREFIHGPTGAAVITVSVPDEADVQVLQPVRPHPWQNNSAYMPVGAALPGAPQDGALALPLAALTEDSVVIVKAEKSHRLAAFDQPDADARLIPSAVQLSQAAVVLVRPNPAPALRLEATMDGNQTDGDLTVFDGQPGVFYVFRLAPAADPIDLPAYFHQQDDFDPAQNKGVEQLAIEVDFVVPRTRTPPAGQPLDPARTPPAPPVLVTGPLAEDTILHIEAIKAQTRVKANLAQTALIAALPDIQAEAPIVDYNSSTRLMVLASIMGDRYQPFLNGQVFRQARLGNGDTLVFRTDSLTDDTTYEMRITRPNSPELPLTRIVNLLVIVRPNPSLPLTLSNPIIDSGQMAIIQLGSSQPGVSYQLITVGDSPIPVGDPVTGDGETIALPTGPLTQTTTFGVRAAKLSNASAVVDLAQTVTVQVGDNGG